MICGKRDHNYYISPRFVSSHLSASVGKLAAVADGFKIKKMFCLSVSARNKDIHPQVVMILFVIARLLVLSCFFVSVGHARDVE